MTKPTGDHLLAVRNIAVEFRGAGRWLRAVDDVSFTLNQGEALGLVGESGSGKSVTARTIMALLPPAIARLSHGDVVVDGTSLYSSPPSRVRALRGRTVAMIFQDPLSSLNPVIPVGRQIAEMLNHHENLPWRRARTGAIGLMERVGIPAASRRYRDYPHEFSGGMRQRAMIAMALALEPAILIADEPTTALDVTVQAQILELLRDLRDEQGMALLLISHDLAVVAEVAHRVAVMYSGQLVELGTIEELYTRPAHPYTLALFESSPRVDQPWTDRPQLGGAPPGLTNIPTGCPFHPRCRFARDKCTSDRPLLQPTRTGALAACHYTDEVMEASDANR